MAKQKVEAPKPPSDKIQALIDIGIPTRMAVFHRTVLSKGNGPKPGEPETAFYHPEDKAKPSRTANMWVTPSILVVEQKGIYKLIPMANVSDTEAL